MKKLLVSVSLLAFIFIGLFGMNLSTMSKDTDGKMANCPLISSSSSICQMGILEHISKWQQMFQAPPFTNISILFLLGLFFTATVSYIGKHFSLAPLLSIKLNYYQKEHPDIGFDKLLLAFSDGILHPKIYN